MFIGLLVRKSSDFNFESLFMTKVGFRTPGSTSGLKP